jgi:hypothetical protein
VRAVRDRLLRRLLGAPSDVVDRGGDHARRRLLLALLLAGCTRATKDEDPVKTDLEQLSRLVRWPATPLRAQWQVIEPARHGAPGPDDWQLAAVVELAPADRQRLQASSKPAAVDTRFAAAFVLPWFPPDLRSRFRPRPDGTVELADPPLDAGDFASPPLGGGFWLPFGEGGRLLLFLSTR